MSYRSRPAETSWHVPDTWSKENKRREAIELAKERYPWWLYVPLWAVMLAIVTPALNERKAADDAATRTNLAATPLEEGDKLVSEYFAMQQEASVRNEPANAEPYFVFLDRKDAWIRKVNKRLASTPYDQYTQKLQTYLGKIPAYTSTLQSEYVATFGNDGVTAARDAHDKAHPKHWPNDTVQPDYKNMWKELRLAYMPSVFLFMLGFLPLSVLRRNMKLWYEIWRIPLASLLPFVSWAVYPIRIDERRQVRQALNFACLAISAIVSIFGGGVQMAKAQSGPTGSSKSTAQKSDKRFGGTLSGAIEMYPVTDGHDKGLLASPQYFGSFKAPGVAGSFFGFAEAGKVPFFTNNSVNIASAKVPSLTFSAELGGTKSGSFSQVGFKIGVPKLPIIGKHVQKAFPFLAVGRFWKTHGGRSQENYLAWATAKIPLALETHLHSEGMMRFRAGHGHRNTIGQPQLWLSRKSLARWKLGIEFWISGTNVTPRFGLMYSR